MDAVSEFKKASLFHIALMEASNWEKQLTPAQKENLTFNTAEEFAIKKIFDKYKDQLFDLTQPPPAITENTILIATDPCHLQTHDGTPTVAALIVGKEYPVKKILNSRNQLIISSEIDDSHYFSLDLNDLTPGSYWENYFKIKEPYSKNTPA